MFSDLETQLENSESKNEQQIQSILKKFSTSKLFYFKQSENIMSPLQELNNIESLFECLKYPQNSKLFDELQIFTLEQQNGELKQFFEIKISMITFLDTDSYFFIISDITERILDQIQKDQIVYKTQIFSSFSHELRTPLNGALYVLEQFAPKQINEEIKVPFQELKNSYLSLKLLENTLNDFIDFSLFLVNQFSPIYSKFHLKQFFDDTTEIFQSQIFLKQLNFKLHYDDSLPHFILFDYKRLQQIIMNLITNAIKYTLEGHIKVKFKRIKQNEIKISVSDTGIGMEEHQSNKLYALLNNPQNINAVQNKNSTSCGLGLIITQNIAIKLDSQIFFRSIDKKGSKFFLTIRNQEDSEGLPSLQDFNQLSEEIDFTPFNELLNYQSNNTIFLKTQKKVTLNKIKKNKAILIVDDDCFNLFALESILKKLGKNCIKALNGQQAIDIILTQQYQIELIFMDYQMPVLDGIEATKQIKQLQQNKNLILDAHIIGCTAFGGTSQINACLVNGMTEVVLKPINYQSVKNILQKYL